MHTEAKSDDAYEKLSAEGNLSSAQPSEILKKTWPKDENQAAYNAWSQKKKLLASHPLHAGKSIPTFDVGKFVELLNKTSYNKHEDREKLRLAMYAQAAKFFAFG